MEDSRETKTLLIDRLKDMRLAVSIPLLITIIGTTYYTGALATGWYEDWHDVRYPRREEVILAAQATRIEEQIAGLQQSYDATDGKVNQVAAAVTSLQISAAIGAVGALHSELDRHERNAEDSEMWHKERDRLNRQLEMATAYRDCLLEERPNCERLRGF